MMVGMHAEAAEGPVVARGGVLGDLARLAGRARPVALAGERTLPVLDALAPLLPEGGLRRGTTATATGATGATSLALALVAGGSQAGSWVAAVGLPALGLAGAAEVGVALPRLVLVAEPRPADWPTVVAALLDAVDLVLVRPSHRVRPTDARRLAARARERGTVLVQAGGRAGFEGADLRLAVLGATWSGLGEGHGHLRARRLEVEVGGRRELARPRRTGLWLPDEQGRVRLDDPAGHAGHAGRADPHAPADPAGTDDEGTGDEGTGDEGTDEATDPTRPASAAAAGTVRRLRAVG